MPGAGPTQREKAVQRVLLVDDDVSMRALLPRILLRKGFEVHAAADADAAEQLLEKEAFDAVVVDLQMPGRDGFALVSAVQRRWPSVRVIIVSAFDSDATRRRAATLQVHGFLAKPVGVEELVLCLRR